MSIKEFEDIIDEFTMKMGDYTDTYEFFRFNWESLIAENPYMKLKDAIEIKNMYDLAHSQQKLPNSEQDRSKKTKKKKKKRK